MTDSQSLHSALRVDPVMSGVPADDPGGLPPVATTASSGKRLFLALAAVALALAALGYYTFHELFTARAPVAVPEPPTTAPSVAPPVAPSSTAEPAIRHPLETVPGETGAPALPALNESDAALVDAFAGLVGRDAIGRWLQTSDLIRRIVVTVDNLPRHKVPQRLSPIAPTPGAFAVAGPDANRSIAPENFARYVPLVRLLEAVDAERAVALYVRWYPLFQEAYREQGYPTRYFNDRLVEALDVMLATPVATGSIALAQPRVLYEFADPELAALPAGQKIMLRIGPENAAHVKAKLAEIRRLVATERPQ